MKWPAARIAAFAEQAGFRPPGLVTAVAVALATSGGDGTWSWSSTPAGTVDVRGLFGVDVGRHPELLSFDLFDPVDNARAALELVTSSPAGWEAFTAYTTGRYRQFVPAAEGAVSGAGGSSSTMLPRPGVDLDGAGRHLVRNARRLLDGVTNGLPVVGRLR